MSAHGSAQKIIADIDAGRLSLSSGRRRLGKIIRSTVPDAHQAHWMAQMEQKLQSQRQAKVKRRTEQRIEARQRFPNLSRLRTPGVAAFSAADSGLLGASSNVAGALGALPVALQQGVNPVEGFRLAKEKFGIASEASRSLNPGAAVVGDVAGFFGPTPAAKVAKLGFQAASGRLSRLAANRATDGMTRRAATQIGANLVGSGGALAASGVAQGVVSDDVAFSDSFDLLTENFLSNTNLALNVGTGLLSAKFRTAGNAANLLLLQEAKRTIPGFRPTPDFLRAGSESGANLRQLMGFVGTMRPAIKQKYMETRVWGPMQETLQRIRVFGSTKARSSSNAQVGGRAIRETALDTGNANAGRAQQGRITRRRKGQQSEAFRTDGGIPIGPKLQEGLASLITGEEARLSGVKFRDLSPEMRKALGEFRRILKEDLKMGRGKGGRFERETLTLQNIEDFRQVIGEVGKIASKTKGVVSPADREMTQSILRYIGAINRTKSSPIDQATQNAKGLRALLEQFPKNLHKVDDEAALEAMFSGRNADRLFSIMEGTARKAGGRGENVTSALATKTELQAIRGWYLNKFLEKVSNESSGGEMLSAKAIEKSLRRGMFRTKLFDRVLPGLRKELESLGAIGDDVAQGIGQARGSATADRASTAGQVLAASQSINGITTLLSGGGGASVLLNTLLGMVGMNQFLRSLTSGSIARQLNNLASGQVVAGPGRLSALAADRESFTRDFGNVIGEGARVGGDALGALIQRGSQ